MTNIDFMESLFSIETYRKELEQNPCKNIDETFYGMCEEFHEVEYKIKNSDIDGIINELGDLLWYVLMFSLITKIKIIKIIKNLSVPININASVNNAIANSFSTMKRKHRGDYANESYYSNFKPTIKVFTGYILDTAFKNQIPMSRIIEQNKEKISSRNKRKTISGHGDFR